MLGRTTKHYNYLRIVAACEDCDKFANYAINKTYLPFILDRLLAIRLQFGFIVALYQYLKLSLVRL